MHRRYPRHCRGDVRSPSPHRRLSRGDNPFFMVSFLDDNLSTVPAETWLRNCQHQARQVSLRKLGKGRGGVDACGTASLRKHARPGWRADPPLADMPRIPYALLKTTIIEAGSDL